MDRERNYNARWREQVAFLDVNCATVRQTPRIVSKLGEEAELKCTVEGQSSGTMYWYRQNQGKEPQLMFYSAAVPSGTAEGETDGFTAKRVIFPFIDLFLYRFFSDVNSVTVRQTPSAVSKSMNESVELKCTVEGKNTGAMYWYRQNPGKELQLMFYSPVAPTVNREEAEDGFTAERPSGSDFNLESSSLKADDSAVYYCAWSIHSETERGGS
ncbi:hypothetical protein chiPu_0012173 [Chiloscyllium punctatum]|uniref:Ig-like domain-containing protein n=1 Tax=Chiloscyllium punctatum TaxID=137246 RepID=A0A401STK7_CHIPU|nr:hypothetical protein [Chiloscyllium punctatum]